MFKQFKKNFTLKTNEEQPTLVETPPDEANVSQLTVPVQTAEAADLPAYSESTDEPAPNSAPPRQRAAPLKLREKKPFRIGKGLLFGPVPAIIAVTLPVLIAVVTYAISPTARLYFETQNDSHSAEERDAYLDQAFKASHHLDILNVRAVQMFNNGEEKKARILFTKLANSNVKDPDVYLKLAQLNLNVNGNADKTKALLNKAAAIAKAHCQAFPIDTDDESETLYMAARMMLDYSDTASVLDICKMQPHQKMNEAHINYLKGLVLREQGKDADSLALLEKTKAASETDLDGKELEHFSDCARALLALDRSDPATAEKIIKDGHKTIFYDWLPNIPLAWSAYDQGHYDKALRLTIAATGRDNQASAAIHLLRSHIYSKQNQLAEAKEELQNYRAQGRTGITFIPKPYRHWINEARAGQK